MKQAVRKKINKKRYLYPLTVSLPESMVFTLVGLLTRRSSRDRCRDKLRALYPSNKILLQFSWTHFHVNHNKWPSKRPTQTRDAIQYETKHHFSTSPHSVCTVLFTVFFMIKIICILFSSIGVSRSCWCAQAGHQMSLSVEHMACCLFGAMCSHVDCLSPPILLRNHCFSGSSCVSLVCLPI